MEFLRRLGGSRTVAIGNGVDDISMIEEAGLGISVLSKEGTVALFLGKADLLFRDILDALDFLLKPLRQKATLGK